MGRWGVEICIFCESTFMKKILSRGPAWMRGRGRFSKNFLKKNFHVAPHPCAST
jgi:hypothetical protein